MFELRHINRLHFPNKYVLICEDDLHHQHEFALLMKQLFDRQGTVDFTFTSSGIVAASVVEHMKNIAVQMSGGNKAEPSLLKLIILDHDMPLGNASDLLQWMNTKMHNVPVITASGISQNNDHMKRICDDYGIECHKFQKPEVTGGFANDLIKEILLR